MTETIAPEKIAERPIEIPPHPRWPELSPDEIKASKSRITKLLREQDATLVAHYYTDGSIQELAEETGGCVADSLEMARISRRHW